MKIVYIGNKLSKHGYTPTSVETLGLKLENYHYLVRVSDFKNQILRFLHMLMTILRNRDADVVLIDTYSTFGFWFAYFSSKLCLLLRIPYIAILRGGNLPARVRKSKKAASEYLRKARFCVTPSNYLKTELYPLVPLDYILIPNYINLEDYPFKSREIISKGKIKLLWVRSFHQIYNPCLAVDILNGLVNKFGLDAELCMVGPDKDGSLNTVKNKAEKAGLSDRIILTGRLSKKEWISESQDYHFFINTTNIDNTPVSVMEAMALGMVILSTDVGGLPYLIENNKNGILLKPNDPALFCQEIASLVSQPERIAQLSEGARIKSLEWDWSKIAIMWEKLLEKV